MVLAGNCDCVALHSSNIPGRNVYSACGMRGAWQNNAFASGQLSLLPGRSRHGSRAGSFPRARYVRTSIFGFRFRCLLRRFHGSADHGCVASFGQSSVVHFPSHLIVSVVLLSFASAGRVFPCELCRKILEEICEAGSCAYLQCFGCRCRWPRKASSHVIRWNKEYQVGAPI